MLASKEFDAESPVLKKVSKDDCEDESVSDPGYSTFYPSGGLTNATTIWCSTHRIQLFHTTRVCELVVSTISTPAG